ncbi:MAG: ADP-ribosylglycohydrolase family protein [Acidobacteriota bacterium]
MSERPCAELRRRSEAALCGALVGDAAGATLEFLGRRPTEDDVEHALGLPGGGCWEVGPGQVTDDGELLISLARGLVQGGGDFDLDAIAARYSDWLRSEPFDVGMTIGSAFGASNDSEDGDGLAAAMQEQARRRGSDSKANGSLMRCMPLAVWGHDLDDDELARVGRLDSSLSHVNPSCTDAVAAYLIAMATLLRGGDRDKALAAAQDWIERDGEPEVREWFAHAASGEVYPFHPQAGYARIAFEHAFRHLRLGSTYLEALRETLRGGGDTDTNACIVGGLVAAAEGAVPRELVEPVLVTWRWGGQVRPDRFTPHDLLELVDALLAVAPSGRSESQASG